MSTIPRNQLEIQGSIDPVSCRESEALVLDSFRVTYQSPI